MCFNPVGIRNLDWDYNPSLEHKPKIPKNQK